MKRSRLIQPPGPEIASLPLQGSFPLKPTIFSGLAKTLVLLVEVEDPTDIRTALEALAYGPYVDIQSHPPSQKVSGPQKNIPLKKPS